VTGSIERRRLFFCVTPLNILIAQAIRAREPGRDTIVYAPSLRSPKYQFYYDRFRWDKKVCAIAGPGRLPDLAYEAIKSLKVLRSLRERHYDELIFASIGSITFSSIARRYRDARIATFDDGTLHADAQTFEGWLKSEPRTHRVFRCVTGVASNADVLSRVERHYTIYPARLCTLPVPQVVEIPLFDGLRAPSAASRPLEVLLGTPETALVLGIDETAYERLIRRLNPDVYLPHPRERRCASIRLPGGERDEILQRAEVLAAEDFVLELVKLGYNPSIKGFGSTALLNLSRHFATTTYYPAGRPPPPIFEKLGVATEPLEPLLG
jgi:hypothetical protein